MTSSLPNGVAMTRAARIAIVPREHGTGRESDRVRVRSIA
jgi:hypothetical protein